MTDYVYTGNGSYILGTNTSYLLATNTSVASTTYVNSVNTSMKNYVDGLGVSNYNASYNNLIRTDYVYTGNTSYVLTNNGSYILGTNTTYALDSEVTAVNTSMKNYVDATNTSMKNYVDGLGVSNYNASYVNKDGSVAMTGNLSLGSKYINSLITGNLGSDAVNKTYADTKSYNATYDAKPSSNYNATYDAKLQNPIFGYVTLMAGSAMVTTTNPTTMNQWEKANGPNYISLNFTNGGSEQAQWIVDFPADWNATANVVFTALWTADDGTGGTVNYVVAGKLFPDDAALNTALATIGTCNDTWIANGDVHVSAASTGATISSVATGGNTAIIKVTRDSGTDTFDGTSQLLGLRIKYVTNKA